MNVKKREMDTIGKLMLAFVTLIIGIVLIGQIATTGSTVTTLSAVSSEAHNVLPTYATGFNSTNINPAIVYTLTNVPTWGSDCPITDFALKNSSGTAFTVTTDYVVNVNSGTYTLVDSATGLANLGVNTTAKPAYASYNYCPSTYLNSSWGRTVLNLVPGFFALACLLISVGLFYSIARDEGIIAR